MKPEKVRIKGSLFITLLIGIPTLFFLALVNLGTGSEVVSTENILPAEAMVPQPIQTRLEKPARTISGTFDRNSTFCQTMTHLRLPREDIQKIIDCCAPVYDLARIRAGNQYTVQVEDDGAVSGLRYAIDDERFLTVRREDQNFRAEVKQLKFIEKVDALCGSIATSLFHAIREVDESAALALMLADIFAWDIDFYTDIRKGDIFNMVFEKKYHQGEFVKYGRIRAAKIVSNNETHVGIWYEDPDGHGDYYDLEGNSLRKAFLKSPLKYSRISSGFSYRRYHPILKTYRPHLGVDYAAPSGTPVQAIGDGTVIFAAYGRQEGRMIKVRHNSTYTSYYLHLSRFAKGIKKGARVAQGQVIGYVGSTGLSTGPHLDFRIKKHKSFVNPMKIKSEPAAPVNPAYLHAFKETRDRMMNRLVAASHPTVS
jgi:murein DD-endopeptidase MepM/ murein hydrolase activator NlpD